MTPADTTATRTSLIAKAEQWVTNILAAIGLARRNGLSDATIRTNLTADIASNRNGLGSLRQSIAAETASTQARYYSGAANPADAGDALMMWSAVGVKTCPGCTARHGVVRTFAEWQAAGLPGRGSTPCLWNCRCTLIPVEKAQRIYGVDSPEALTRDARAPIRAREEEVAAAEVDRGADYAPSTVQAKVGDFREKGAPDTGNPATTIKATADSQAGAEARRRFREAGLNPDDPGQVTNAQFARMVQQVRREAAASMS